MKAVRIHEFGGPEVLRYEDVPDAKPSKDQVLVRVKAHILGSDVAGEIVEVGEYVTGFKPGQRVLLAPMHFCNHCAKCVAGLQNQCPEFTVLGNRVDGGNCELIAAPAVNVIPIPDSLDFNQAASVPLVFLTAWHMLVGRAGIRPGQTVLVLGASSGVGIAAITNKEGVDIVVEHVGAATWEQSMKCLKPAGILVTCGATTGPNASFDLRFLYSRQLSLLGSYMGTLGELYEVLGHVFAGRLKPVVDRTFPLKDIRAAHEYMEKSRMFGKVVVNP